MTPPVVNAESEEPAQLTLLRQVQSIFQLKTASPNDVVRPIVDIFLNIDLALTTGWHHHVLSKWLGMLSSLSLDSSRTTILMLTAIRETVEQFPEHRRQGMQVRLEELGARATMNASSSP